MPRHFSKQPLEKIWTGLSASIWTPIVLTLAVIGLVVWMQIRHPSKPVESVLESVSAPAFNKRVNVLRDSSATAAKRVLEKYHISFRIRQNPATRQDVWTVQMPEGIPLPSVHLSLQEGITQSGCDVLRADSDPSTGKTVLQVGYQDSCFFKIHLIPFSGEQTAKGKIALVIDDFGDRLDSLALDFFNLDGKITISVIPGRRLSEKVAREAANHGCEVILHLAMEPLYAAFREDGFTIMTKMPREQIQVTFQKALDQLPNVVGVNNHMGSRATSDRQTMMDVMEGIKQRGLYFVDSYTVASSVAYDVAKEMGVSAAKRDVFVDVVGTEEAIREKLWELARKAKKNGTAVGIGHCHRNMLSALQKEMTSIQNEGLRFVPMSEAVQ